MGSMKIHHDPFFAYSTCSAKAWSSRWIWAACFSLVHAASIRQLPSEEESYRRVRPPQARRKWPCVTTVREGGTCVTVHGSRLVARHECQAPAPFDPFSKLFDYRDLSPVRERTAIAAAPPKPRRWWIKHKFRHADTDDAHESRKEARGTQHGRKKDMSPQVMHHTAITWCWVASSWCAAADAESETSVSAGCLCQ